MNEADSSNEKMADTLNQAEAGITDTTGNKE